MLEFFVSTAVCTLFMGLAVGGDGNNQWDWERNRNKSWFDLGAGMGTDSWEPMGGSVIERDIPSHLYTDVLGHRSSLTDCRS